MLEYLWTYSLSVSHLSCGRIKRIKPTSSKSFLPRVPSCLLLLFQNDNLSYGMKFNLQDNERAIKSHFIMKGCAPGHGSGLVQDWGRSKTWICTVKKIRIENRRYSRVLTGKIPFLTPCCSLESRCVSVQQSTTFVSKRAIPFSTYVYGRI